MGNKRGWRLGGGGRGSARVLEGKGKFWMRETNADSLNHVAPCWP